MLGHDCFCLLGWIILILVLLGSGCKSSSPTVSQEKASPAASDLHIGVMDMQWLLKQSKLGEQVTDALIKFSEDRQALIQLEQKELRNLELSLIHI